tara:strand:- start:142 stop:342 length:201 start_codon:yes stop_codon:yes gene_type:complete
MLLLLLPLLLIVMLVMLMMVSSLTFWSADRIYWIKSADRPIQGLGVPTVKCDDLECGIPRRCVQPV